MLYLQSKRLSDNQHNIVVSDNYPQYLKAGAGTGKTEILIQKILNEILKNDNESLDSFAIITFTNKATEEKKCELDYQMSYTQNGYMQMLLKNLNLDNNVKKFI